MQGELSQRRRSLTRRDFLDYTAIPPMMIEVQSISRRYGSLLAVNEISFSVGEGEILGFLGPNGAGKTTTMRILVGALGASSGVARVAGHDMATQSRQARRALGYLPDTPPLYPSMTVRDYLDYAARLRGVSSRKRRDAVAGAVSRTGLEQVGGRLIANLSRGYRQRVGLAQALVHDPKVLILDEPTTGLDPAQVAEIRNLIRELRGERTVVLSTHILSEVTATCDRVVIIARGQLVASGTEDELHRQLGAEHRIRLQLSRPDGDTLAALRGIAGVEAADEQAEGHFIVNTGRVDLRESINEAAQRWGLLESRSEGGLEELYLSAVAEREA